MNRREMITIGAAGIAVTLLPANVQAEKDILGELLLPYTNIRALKLSTIKVGKKVWVDIREAMFAKKGHKKYARPKLIRVVSFEEANKELNEDGDKWGCFDEEGPMVYTYSYSTSNYQVFYSFEECYLKENHWDMYQHNEILKKYNSIQSKAQEKLQVCIDNMKTLKETTR